MIQPERAPLAKTRIEQRSLLDLPMPHHDSQSCFSQRLNQRISTSATADFFNKIGHKWTLPPFQFVSCKSKKVTSIRPLKSQPSYSSCHDRRRRLTRQSRSATCTKSRVTV